MCEEKLVCSYIRLSEEDTNKKNTEKSQSILNQSNFIKNYAKKNNLTIHKEYIDDGYTGLNYERAGFESLIKDIEDGKIAIVITKDLSRLGREYIETGFYITKYFPANNVRYIAINDNYDSDKADSMYSDIMVAFKSLVNDKYSKDTSIKVKEAKRLKTVSGNYMGFIAPYGYKKVKIANRTTLEIDKEVSHIIERIFTEIATGLSRKEVALRLNKDKIPSPITYLEMTKNKNKKYYLDWTDKIVYRILKNETYIGNMIIRKSTKMNYKQKKRDYIPIRQREIKENTHPAIISRELFTKANKNLKQFNKRSNLNKNYKSILENLVICGKCQNTMKAIGVLKESGNTHYHFECMKTINRKPCSNRTISETKLKEIVYRKLLETIKKISNTNTIVEKATKKTLKKDNLNTKIKNLNIDIDIHNSNIRDLYLKKAIGEITLELFVEKKETETILKQNKEKLLEKLIKENNEVIKRDEMIKKYNEFMTSDNIYNYIFRDLIKCVIINDNNSLVLQFNFKIAEDEKVLNI